MAFSCSIKFHSQLTASSLNGCLLFIHRTYCLWPPLWQQQICLAVVISPAGGRLASDRYVWCPYNGLLHPQLFTCNIYWSGVIFQDQYFLEDNDIWGSTQQATAFASCWNRDRQMWDVWCPELLHPELCYTRTSNQRYVFIWDISLSILLKETRVCVCVCLQNWTNFCPYGLNSTPIST